MTNSSKKSDILNSSSFSLVKDIMEERSKLSESLLMMQEKINKLTFQVMILKIQNLFEAHPILEAIRFEIDWRSHKDQRPLDIHVDRKFWNKIDDQDEKLAQYVANTDLDMTSELLCHDLKTLSFAMKYSVNQLFNKVVLERSTFESQCQNAYELEFSDWNAWQAALLDEKLKIAPLSKPAPRL